MVSSLRLLLWLLTDCLVSEESGQMPVCEKKKKKVFRNKFKFLEKVFRKNLK